MGSIVTLIRRLRGDARGFTAIRRNDTIEEQADVAQLVEQLIRNQQVVSSSLTVGSRIRMKAWPLECGRSFLLGLLRLSLYVNGDTG